MREFFDLANNPLFVRHVRSRLRRSALVSGILLFCFLNVCILLIDEEFKKDLPVGPILFFGLQSVLLMLVGGAQVAISVGHIKDTGIIDFHRVTPVPAPVQAIGILLGAPIRELVFYSITLPFSFFCAAVGDVGIFNWCKLLLVQLGLALMSYSIAFVTGLSGKSGKGASGRFVGMMIGLSVAANALSALGIYGPWLLTPMPVAREIFGKIIEEKENKQLQIVPQGQPINPPAAAPQIPPAKGMGQPIQPLPPGGPQIPPAKGMPQPIQPFPPGGPLAPGGQQLPPGAAQPLQPNVFTDITFYRLPIPVVLQSLMFQGTFLTFLFIAASRRMRSNRLPLFTKPCALLFLALIAFLTLGSVWSSPKVIMVLGQTYFLLFCYMLLIATVSPPTGDVVKGLARALRLGRPTIAVWSDYATNKFVAPLFTAIIALSVALGIALAAQPALPGLVAQLGIGLAPIDPAPPLIVATLAALYFGWAKQYMQIAFDRRANSFFGLLIFGTWVAPMILGGIIHAVDLPEGGYIMALSPFAGISLSGAAAIPQLDQTVVVAIAIVPQAILAAVFLSLLLREERIIRQRVAAEYFGHEKETPRVL